MPEACDEGTHGVRGDDIGYEEEENAMGNNVGTEGIHKTLVMIIESEELEKKDYAARQMGGRMALHAMSASRALDVMSAYLTVNKAQLFPTRRRPERRTMSTAPPEECEDWVRKKGINIYDGLTREEKEAANRLIYLAGHFRERSFEDTHYRPHRTQY